MPDLVAKVRPFRGLRYAKERVDLASVLSPAPAKDPRHALRLLDESVTDGDGKDAPVRRARLKLAEWQRAGVVVRDASASMYAVRRGGDPIALFVALGLDGTNAIDGSGTPPESRFDVGVAVEPVVCGFGEARVKRTLENAVDREADASWTIDGTAYELWCVDEESATARIATLLSQSPLALEKNAALLAAQASWWKRTISSSSATGAAGAGGRGDDDKPLAGAFALAFLHPADEAWPDVPVGAALLPLVGTLDP